MAAPLNLVVNLTFNPPEIRIFGPISDTTIANLEKLLPGKCTSSPGQKGVCVFTREDSPPHWLTKLPGAYANEETGQSQVMLAILDLLEGDSGAGGALWKLKATNALNHDDIKETYKFFFVGRGSGAKSSGGS